MISIPISSLKPVITGLSKVVSNKSSLECLRCVRVDATPDRTSILGTDLDMFAWVRLPEANCDKQDSFLVPLERLQSMAKRFNSQAVLNIEPGRIFCDLVTGRVSENVEAPKLKEFPLEPEFGVKVVALPESFPQRFSETMGCSSTDQTRYVLNGIQLDVSDPASHYMVSTDGHHLFSANSFVLPISESVTIPNHKLLLWRGLSNLPWALAGQRKKNSHMVRIAAGNWTLTLRAIEGNYPNWRQVIPDTKAHRTIVTLPEEHEFTAIVNGLPGGELRDRPVDLVVENGSVSVRDTTGGPNILLAGATAKGPNIRLRLNRDYLTKAFDYGLTRIGLIDPMSSMHFTQEGRQMVVMPLRVADGQSVKEPTNQTAPVEPQQERKPMPAINGHTNGAATSHTNGAQRSTTPENPAAEKPAIEVALDKLDGFKATFREALIGVTEITTLLRQAVRDQKAGEKEIHQVRQTIRSLQGVRI